MAKGRLGVLFAHLSGTIGDVVIRRHKDGTVVARRPKRSDVPRTPAQRRREMILREAVAWARQMLNEPRVRALYDKVAKRKGKRTYDLMKSDFMRPPRVQRVDVSEYSGSPGEVIKIKAEDNVKVTGVNVSLLLEDGEVLEEGDAEETFRGWRYTTRREAPAGTTVRVVATAMDRPGGSHTLETEVGLPPLPWTLS